MDTERKAASSVLFAPGCFTDVTEPLPDIREQIIAATVAGVPFITLHAVDGSSVLVNLGTMLRVRGHE